MKCERFLQLPLNELRDMHSNMHAYNSETQLVLFHLEKMGKLNVKASSDQPIVPAMKAKRLPQSNTELSISPAEQKEKKFNISQIDGRLIDLEQTEKLLKDEISNMESKIISLEVTARRRLNGASRESVSIFQVILSLKWTHVSYFCLGKKYIVSPQTTTIDMWPA